MSSSDFRATLLELMDTSPEPMDHPAPDRWLAYHRGELPEDEEARLQEHLARCRDCFDLAAGAAAFTQPDGEPGVEPDIGTDALWRLLRPRLDPPADPQPVSPPGSNVREISAGPRRRPSWRGRLPQALAASFFVALVALSLWSLRQKSALEANRAPRPNVAITDFADGERALPGPEQTLPPGPRMLVLHPGEDLPVYRLAIRDAATGRELSSHELRPNQDLALTVYLPEGLPPGRYRLELADGAGGTGGKALETYLLRVTEPGRGE